MKDRPAVVLLAAVALSVGGIALTGDLSVPMKGYAAAAANVLSLRESDFTAARASIVEASPPVFADAHATAVARGKMFVGMARTGDNPFSANDIIVFDDPQRLSSYARVPIPEKGDIETMAYEPSADAIYFIMSNGSDGLVLYRMDPHDLSFRKIAASSTVDVGRRPAIVADKDFVYGIANTDPSTVFRVRVSDGSIAISRSTHIPYGHSAALGMDGTTTELYFGGGMSGMFEKTDAATLGQIRTIHLRGCVLTDDLPYERLDAASGYVYVGCETTPEGYRIRTSNLELTRFALPGRSFGLFIHDGDLYNAAYDSTIDVFPRQDIGDLHRHYIANAIERTQNPSMDLFVNELMFPTDDGSVYMTSWWNVKGLFKVEMGK